MAVRTYDPKLVTVSVDGTLITGLARDSFVKVEHDEDAWTKKVSADGFTSRAKSNNYTGKITLTVMQTSDGNAFLETIFFADKGPTSGGVVQITIIDNSGASKHTTANAWIQKHTDSELGAEEKEREWIFDCDEIEMYEGGNVV